MRSILFYTQNSDLLLKYNISKFWRNEVWIAAFFFGVMGWITYLIIRNQPSIGSEELKFMAVLFVMYLVPFVYRIYKAYVKGELLLKKTETGFVLKKDRISVTSEIDKIIIEHQTGKYDEGFDVSIRDTNKEVTTLFTGLPESDAMSLSVFLAIQMDIIIEQIDRDL